MNKENKALQETGSQRKKLKKKKKKNLRSKRKGQIPKINKEHPTYE